MSIANCKAKSEFYKTVAILRDMGYKEDDVANHLEEHGVKKYSENVVDFVSDKVYIHFYDTNPMMLRDLIFDNCIMRDFHEPI